MYAYQWWADTTTGLLKIRNSANSAWVTLFELDGTLVASDISLGAGSVGGPSLFFTGDPNTGLFSPGADTIALVTGGTNRVHVTSGGLVGIGSTSPAQKLEIQDGSISVGSSANVNATNVLIAGYGYILSGTKYGNASLRSTYNNVNSAASLEFYVASSGTSTAEAMRLDSSGRLLVGTVSMNANGGILQLGSGITFPATAVAASDANTLDDYEEGTWTPTQGAGLTVVGAFSSAGHYTKIGRQVTIQGYVAGATSIAVTSNTIICQGLPFSVMNVTGSSFVGGASNSTLTALINVWAQQISDSVYAVTSMAATGSITFTFSYFTA